MGDTGPCVLTRRKGGTNVYTGTVWTCSPSAAAVPLELVATTENRVFQHHSHTLHHFRVFIFSERRGRGGAWKGRGTEGEGGGTRKGRGRGMEGEGREGQVRAYKHRNGGERTERESQRAGWHPHHKL